MTIPTVFVVTPSFNSVDYIDRAIMAVVSQSGRFRIRYHIQDGLSDDGTVERIQWWKNAIETQSFPISCEGLELTYESAADAGMYDALARAFDTFDLPDDAFATWINSDDLVMPGAFAALANIVSTHSATDVAWVTGRRSNASVAGVPREPQWPETLPIREAIAAGICDSVHLGCIQQEGTAFRGWLWHAARDAGLFEDCKLAGDWLLWTKMAQHADLYQLQFSLGRFHAREGQLSANMDAYVAEIERFIPTAARTEALCAFLSQEDAVSLQLYFDEETCAFVSRECSINRFAFTDHAIAHKPELADHLDAIVPEFSAVRGPLNLPSDVQILDLMKQFAGYTRLWPMLPLSRQIEVRFQRLIKREKRLMERDERMVRLCGRHVSKLADLSDLEQQRWKSVARRHPWKVGLWLALRRYERSVTK
ncbi:MULTISPECIES: hypothetical protein [unclassified Ruegeria]|uniref:hypothetical protein n=1 Tax=unclassified Ruegeria TaxID=2625375 RepID=UPI0014892FA7|nr:MULTISPECIES: hypothetical protein [unclassified Ruegeria]